MLKDFLRKISIMRRNHPSQLTPTFITIQIPSRMVLSSFERSYGCKIKYSSVLFRPFLQVEKNCSISSCPFNIATLWKKHLRNIYETFKRLVS